ncbi:penicillin-binding protein 1A [Piscinibacter sakaiensis]|uniref:penicillin-binding protein 1A n=1 Tax=Piscinibacter sakaiensis TaxID=1547922 RepID=UPI003AAE21E4
MPATDFPPPSNPQPPAGKRQRDPWIGRAFATVGLVMLTGTAALGTWLWFETPDVRAVETRVTAKPSRIVSSDGVVLDSIGANQHRPVALDKVSPAIVHALLATEDRRFHEHGAVDLRRMVAAVGYSLQGDVQGASTLTQQLARNLFPERVGNDRTVLRKLREIVVAMKIERAYSKEQILTMYLNQVPYLYDVVGVEMAARTYFSKPASEIEPHEAALLVAMLKGPNYYDPGRQPERARERRNLVLRLMAREGFLDQASHDEARARPLDVRLSRHDTSPPLAPHFVRLVKKQVVDWAAARGLDPKRDGLTIHVGLDSRLQKLAEQAVERQGELLQSVAASEWSNATLRAGPPAKGTKVREFAYFWQTNPALRAEVARQTAAYREAREGGADDSAALRAAERDPELPKLLAAKTRLEAGFIALDPRSGRVLTWVGSRDWQHDRFDHVAQARRQPGSTFKPFVYGAALAAGIPQYRIFVDAPVTLMTADGQAWRPGDVGGSSGQPMLMRTGLSRSRNTITAQVMQQVGPQAVARFAKQLGVEQSPLDPVLSLALGTSPVTLLEMAGAYGSFASLGIRRDPVLIERIDDSEGRMLASFGSSPRRVLEPDQAALLVDILREAVESGTGTQLRSRFGLQADIAGKTGTTQRNSDGWFLSLQPELVVGAWVGFNDQRVTMRSNRWGQGGHSALLLVGDFLREGAKDKLIDMEARFPTVQRPAPPVIWTQDPVEQEGLTWDSVASADGSSDGPPSLPVRSERFRFDEPSPSVAVAAMPEPPPPIRPRPAPVAAPQVVIEPVVAPPVPIPVEPATPRVVAQPVERVTPPPPTPLPVPRPIEVPAPPVWTQPVERPPQPVAVVDRPSAVPVGRSIGQPVGQPVERPVPAPLGRPIIAPPSADVLPPTGVPIGTPYERDQR